MVNKVLKPLTKNCFKDRFLFLLVSILCLLVITPIFKDFIGIRVLMDIFFTTTLIFGTDAAKRAGAKVITKT